MRPRKADKYDEQRETICQKIIKILELDENGEFILWYLDENEEKQKEIMALSDDIKICFEVSDIGVFKPNYVPKKPYIAIVRSILRKQGYIVKSKDVTFKISEGLFRRSKIYKILRD